jgi:hypothetical protein
LTLSKILSQSWTAAIQVPLGVRSVEGILILGVDGLLVEADGSVIFAVTKLKVRHDHYCE